MAGNAWAHSCRGKVKYQSRRRALAAIRELQYVPGIRDPETLMPYRCREGPHWHVGHAQRHKIQPLKIMVAAVGDVVEIVWRSTDGSEVKTRHEAPQTGRP